MTIKATIRQLRDIHDMLAIRVLVDHRDGVSKELKIGEVVSGVLVNVITFIYDRWVFHFNASRRLEVDVSAP